MDAVHSLLGGFKVKVHPMGSASLLSVAAKRLEGKVALVTGGSSDIGECTARLFSKHGAKVVIADIQDDLGHSVCKDLDSSSYIHCDVTKENHVENAVNTAVSKYGKLDIRPTHACMHDDYDGDGDDGNDGGNQRNHLRGALMVDQY